MSACPKFFNSCPFYLGWCGTRRCSSIMTSILDLGLQAHKIRIWHICSKLCLCEWPILWDVYFRWTLDPHILKDRSFAQTAWNRQCQICCLTWLFHCLTPIDITGRFNIWIQNLYTCTTSSVLQSKSKFSKALKLMWLVVIKHRNKKQESQEHKKYAQYSGVGIPFWLGGGHSLKLRLQ